MNKYLIVTAFNGDEANDCTTAEIIEAESYSAAALYAKKKGDRLFADADDVDSDLNGDADYQYNYRDEDVELDDEDDITDCGKVWVKQIELTPVYLSVITNILDLQVYNSADVYQEDLDQALEDSEENGCEESNDLSESVNWIDDGQYFVKFFKL